MKLTPTMMGMLRQRFGLNPDDTKKDAEILKLTPVEVVQECTAWQIGDPGWANQIAQWMKAAGAKPQDF
jgi:hypothetical protein